LTLLASTHPILGVGESLLSKNETTDLLGHVTGLNID